LIGRARLILDIGGRLLGLQEELARAADAEAVVRGFGIASDCNGIFVDDILVGFGVAGSVGHIPPQGIEEGIEKFSSELGFVVTLRFIVLEIALEAGNEVGNDGGDWGHARSPGYEATQGDAVGV
jgi:hypothetical protein